MICFQLWNFHPFLYACSPSTEKLESGISWNSLISYSSNRHASNASLPTLSMIIIVVMWLFYFWYGMSANNFLSRFLIFTYFQVMPIKKEKNMFVSLNGKLYIRTHWCVYKHFILSSRYGTRKFFIHLRSAIILIKWKGRVCIIRYNQVRIG